VALQTPARRCSCCSRRKRAGFGLTGFELMSDFCLQLVCKHFPDQRLPFAQPHPQYVLLELSDNESEDHARTIFETLIGQALEQGLAQDAVIAASLAQSRALWRLRESISMAQAHEGKNIKRHLGADLAHRRIHGSDR
jgi:FAD/FMN-containing dehydrogenase